MQDSILRVSFQGEPDLDALTQLVGAAPYRTDAPGTKRNSDGKSCCHFLAGEGENFRDLVAATRAWLIERPDLHRLSSLARFDDAKIDISTVVSEETLATFLMLDASFMKAAADAGLSVEISVYRVQQQE